MSEESRRRTARLVLEALAGTDFVLTGASALLEHGLINRPTVDVDAFTAVEQGTVPDALDAVTRHLRTYGAEVERHRVFPDFADATVRWGEAEVPLDLGVDWRAHPPAFSGIGPVLDPRDAAGSKLAALYSRREDRDYLDIGSILLTGPWGPEELIALGAEHDPGLDLTQLLRTLDPGAMPESARFRDYGMSGETETALRGALDGLRQHLEHRLSSPASGSDHRGDHDGREERA